MYVTKILNTVHQFKQNKYIKNPQIIEAITIGT